MLLVIPDPDVLDTCKQVKVPIVPPPEFSPKQDPPATVVIGPGPSLKMSIVKPVALENPPELKFWTTPVRPEAPETFPVPVFITCPDKPSRLPEGTPEFQI